MVPSGQHTGRTEILWTTKGEEEARKLKERLGTTDFSRVFTSPLQRARQTAVLAALATHIMLNSATVAIPSVSNSVLVRLLSNERH